MCIWPQESTCATSQNAQDFPLRLVYFEMYNSFNHSNSLPFYNIFLSSFFEIVGTRAVLFVFFMFLTTVLTVLSPTSSLSPELSLNAPDLAHLHSSRAANHRGWSAAQPPSIQEREREKKFSQAKYNRQFTYSPRTAKEADKLCWCEVAVGCSWECSTRFCLHAHSYQHGLGPEGTSRRMNKRGREKCECQRQKQREDNRWWKCDKRGWMLTWRHGENKWRRVKNNRSEKEKVKERKALMPSLLPHLTSSDDSWSCLPFSGETSVTFPEYINSWGAAKGKQQCGFVYYSPTWATASINEEQSAKSRSDLSAWSDFHSANNRLSTYALFHQSAWFSHSNTHPLLLPETN